MKKQFIAGLSPGDAVDDVFYVRELTTRVARTGQRYAALKLSDRSGIADGRAWDDTAGIESRLEPGMFARVRGTAERYRGKVQVKIHGAAPVDDAGIDPLDFLPRSYRDTSELTGFLEYFMTEVYDADYRALLGSFFDDEDFMRQFVLAPGDASTHHAYLGGLLEHTVSVTTLCQHVAVQHPRLNSDLLITAALLHDVGKTREFEYRGAIGYSREGQLLGHVLLGQKMIEERISRMEGFPKEKELLLVHALISHHGELEWGAPKKPQSAEALVLHHLDNLDAKVKGFFEVVEGRGEVPWPKMQNLFRRPLDQPRAADKEP